MEYKLAIARRVWVGGCGDIFLWLSLHICACGCFFVLQTRFIADHCGCVTVFSQHEPPLLPAASLPRSGSSHADWLTAGCLFLRRPLPPPPSRSEFAKEPRFYFPHNVDFRGRAYPMHPHLNHLVRVCCSRLQGAWVACRLR